MNISTFYFLHNFLFKYEWLDRIIWFFAEPFLYFVLGSILIYLFYHYGIFKLNNAEKFLKNGGRKILSILFSTGFSYFLSFVVKLIFMAPRPALALPNIATLFIESGYAFPSSHSAVISAFAFSIYFRNKKLGYICMIAGLLIGVARVMSGVHFPIDILGGFLLGFLVAYFTKSL